MIYEVGVVVQKAGACVIGEDTKNVMKNVQVFCPRQVAGVGSTPAKTQRKVVALATGSTPVVPGCTDPSLVPMAQDCCKVVVSCGQLYGSCLRAVCAGGKCVDYAAIQAKNKDCQCSGHFTGASCLQCKPNYFGPQCSTYCDAANTCNGKGKCDANGQCVCDLMWRGSDNCNILSFNGEPGKTFGGKAVVKAGGVSCTAATDCSNNGLCMPDGSCMCNLKQDAGGCVRAYYGTDCKYYRSFCTVGMCNVEAGTAAACSNDTHCSGHGKCVNSQCECSVEAKDDCTYKYCGSRCDKWQATCYTQQLSAAKKTANAPDGTVAGFPQNLASFVVTPINPNTGKVVTQPFIVNVPAGSPAAVAVATTAATTPSSAATDATNTEKPDHGSNTAVILLSCLLAVTTIGMMMLGLVLYRSHADSTPKYQKWQDERAESSI
eukprot:NODE_459_length_1669_cov_104.757407_g334_i0.p1 GENE.NODE_459_length_1669_cov_104.757407_g334_i0~~NODE_459_length_1669_cov_104.757407_g334_i0.p1  ORF type:complete len:498 (-),score=118.85 NODE_459_length_1669_cov_104.757407_g334_i0:175-1473(-)